MGRSVVVALLALAGLLCAAGMGYAAYVVSRGSVAVPVTRLQPEPGELAPTRAQARPNVTTTRKRATTTTATAPSTTTTTTTTTFDDHGGNSGRGGGGDDNSGHGGGGHGGDD
jgi:flagellar basal body-associated protein FliL